MTPKEKAEELLRKMQRGHIEIISGHRTKQCALIAVDEIINELSIGYGDVRKNIEYWQEVKNEIEKR